MSKNNNVNPGQYKVAGRERQGEDINPAKEKAAMAQNSKAPHRGSGKQGSDKQTKTQGGS